MGFFFPENGGNGGMLGRARSESPLLTGLHGYWKLDEASGTRVDSSGNGNDLSPTNAPGNAAGKIGNSALFVAASSQKVSRASNASLVTGNIDFTVAFWAYVTNTGTTGCLVSKGDASSFSNIEYECYFSASSGGFLFRVSHGSNFITAVHPTIITANTWYYVVCHNDITLDQIGIRINNGADTVVSMAGFTIPSSTAPFSIGARAIGDAADARVDEVGLWKRLFTAQENTDLYAAGSGLAYPF